MGTRRIVVHLRLQLQPAAQRATTACGLPVTMRRRSSAAEASVNCTACLAAAALEPAQDAEGLVYADGAREAEHLRREAEAEAEPVLVELVAAGTGVEALLFGRSTRVLRPEPGNTRPARAAWWPTRELALSELAELLGRPVRDVAEARKMRR